MPNPAALLANWLLSHLVALGFVSFLAVAILWRGPLFGLQVDADAPVRVPAVESQADSSSASGQPPAEPPPAEDSSAVQHKEPQASAQPAIETLLPRSVAVEGEEQAVFRPAPQDAAADAPRGHDQFVPLEQLRAPGPLQPPSDPVDVAGLLDEARKAFWKGALENAESLYLRYLALRPEDANTFGELGNLYQSMGRPQDALDAYFEAGLRFKAKGQQEQLGQILELFREAGDPRIDQLHGRVGALGE